ncbi:hypothetical protein U1Q18_046131, partial [Sarracenia purpurea var. burkii]
MNIFMDKFIDFVESRRAKPPAGPSQTQAPAAPVQVTAASIPVASSDPLAPQVSPDHEPPISTSFEPTQEAEPPQETSKTPTVSLEEPANVAHVEPLSAPSPHAAATIEEHAIQDEPPVESPATLVQDSSPPVSASSLPAAETQKQIIE